MAVARVSPAARLNANSAFAKKLEAMTARRMEKELKSLSAEVQAEAQRLADAALVMDRDPKRRKKGNKKLGGSFVVEVDTKGGGFPMSLSVRSTAAQKKVAALEYGTRPHRIVGRNRDDKMLIFPSDRQFQGTGSRSYEIGRGLSVVRLDSGKGTSGRQRDQGYGRSRGQKLVKTPEVWHPGNRPYGFMEKALRTVIDRRLRGARLR